MDNKIVSVIVPIYNVELYLEKCINSIINQTYKFLEIILIDDGSTDKSGQICDSYKENDNRIIVIHKKNGGLSSARNIGLDIAKGNLISFVDSDDYLENDMIEGLIDNMNQYNSDISICNYYYIKNNKKIIKKNIFTKESFSISKKDKYYYLFNEYSCLSIYAWNKLYKRKIFDNVRFPEGKIYEYSSIICNILDRSNTISYMSKPLYNYVYRKSSIGNSFNLNHFDKIVSNNRKIDFFREKEYYDLIIKEENKKMDNIISNLSKMKRYNIKNKETFNKYYKELLNTNKNVKWQNANKKVKMWKLCRKSFINILSVMYIVKDLINKKS